ncbi:MAG: TetR/AcrR family transcriptional regulator [Syntrophales bacterium]|nr:TetR/AcrR family transcriptional regulator [Syntrophales bacterium]
MVKAQRKEREFNLRRAEILEQAEKIFAAKGFHNTAVAEIAGASGFAVGTLYQFFPSKEQLYISMLTEKLNMMYSAIRESVVKEADIVKKIEVLVSSQFNFVENNADFCSIFTRGDHLSLSEGSVELRKRLRIDYDIHVSFTEEVIREGIRAGLLKKMDPRMMASALTGIANSYASKWLTTMEGTPLTSYVPFVMDIFLEGVRKDAN